MKNLLGGKGANLAEMAEHRPAGAAGFTITTEVCTEFYGAAASCPRPWTRRCAPPSHKMEKLVGAKFGDPKNPLLVSCAPAPARRCPA